MNITTTPARISIFRAGDFVSSDGRPISFTVSNLQAIARSYEPSLARAPMVVGHPELDDPAYGWAQSLSVEGELLMADVDQVEAQFAAMVNDGRFPNRSASIFLPDSPGNPKPGQYYLKHIGFLGATPPAVTGLPPAQLAAAADAVSFSFPAVFISPEPSMTEKTTPAAPAAPAAVAPTVPAASTNDPVAFAAAQSALDRRAAELDSREQKIKTETLAADRAAAVSFAKGLVDSGKILPAQSDAVVELLVTLPGADQPVSFAQAGATVSKPARDLFRGLFDALPERINYREKSPGARLNAVVSFEIGRAHV